MGLRAVILVVAALAAASPALAIEATSPATWAWTPATGEPDRYDVLVDRGQGWTLERSVVGTQVELEGAPGETIQVKVRGVKGTETGPESPVSELVAWAAPPPAPAREVWWFELSDTRCRQVHGWPEAKAVVWPRASSSVGPRIGCRERP